MLLIGFAQILVCMGILETKKGRKGQRICRLAWQMLRSVLGRHLERDNCPEDHKHHLLQTCPKYHNYLSPSGVCRIALASTQSLLVSAHQSNLYLHEGWGNKTNV